MLHTGSLNTIQTFSSSCKMVDASSKTGVFVFSSVCGLLYPKMNYYVVRDPQIFNEIVNVFVFFHFCT